MAKERDNGIIRVSPEFKQWAIKMKAEKEVRDGRIIGIADITKEIMKCSAINKLEEEMKGSKKEFDLRR